MANEYNGQAVAKLDQAQTFTADQTVNGALIVDTSTLAVDATNNRVGIGTATPHTRLHVSGPIATGIGTVTAAHTITATNSFIIADATTAPFTVTLPTAVGISGREYSVKRINSGGNAVTVACNGAEVIEGVTTYVLSAQYSVITVISNGSNWLIKSKI